MLFFTSSVVPAGRLGLQSKRTEALRGSTWAAGRGATQSNSTQFNPIQIHFSLLTVRALHWGWRKNGKGCRTPAIAGCRGLVIGVSVPRTRRPYYDAVA